MAAFWDARAREDAFFFVDDRLAYRAPDLDRFWAGGEQALDAMLGAVEAPPIEPHHAILDLGCGLGRLTRPLARRAARVVALDVSAEMLARAQALNAHLDNVDWIQGDGRTLPDVSVDVAVSFVVFQHLPDPALALGYVRELGRVLAPGGWAVLHVSNDRTLHGRAPSLARRVAAALGRAPRGQADPRWRGSAVDLDELRATAHEAGLKVDAVTGAGTQWCFARASRGA
jgi:SAM-dependent methyltransferase